MSESTNQEIRAIKSNCFIRSVAWGEVGNKLQNITGHNESEAVTGISEWCDRLASIAFGKSEEAKQIGDSIAAGIMSQ